MTLLPLARAVLASFVLICIGGTPEATAIVPKDGPAVSGTGPATAGSDAAAVATQVETLRQALASGESATAVLDRWCRDHGLAPAGSVRAEKLPPDSFPIPVEAKTKLRPNGRAIVQRRVRLHCGGTLLSEARLWFVPNLLTPAMRRQLARTTKPFGSVVAPLRFRRVQSRITDLSSPNGLVPPPASRDLFSVEAYLVLPDGRLFAFTQEVYKASLLNRMPQSGRDQDKRQLMAQPRSLRCRTRGLPSCQA
jgi:hypothetical protein